MKYYPTKWTNIFLQIIGNIALIIGMFFIFMALWSWPEYLYTLIVGNDDRMRVLLEIAPRFTCWGLLGFLGGAIFPNLFPSLATDENGLYVKFYWKWLFVPWNEITSFREAFISVISFWGTGKVYFVLAKPGRLTLFHWIVSFNQLGGWGPGCLVSGRQEELICTIRAHVANSD